jgi:hypothetical protein
VQNQISLIFAIRETQNLGLLLKRLRANLDEILVLSLFSGVLFSIPEFVRSTDRVGPGFGSVLFQVMDTGVEGSGRDPWPT